MAKITLETIALEIGVSKVAVYKALNNKKGVSDELRQKIVEYSKAVGYITKSSLSDVKNKKFLYFINQDFFLTLSEQFYSTIFYFLSQECSRANSILQIAFLEKDNTLEKMKKVIYFFHPDGIFFAGEVDQSIIRYMETVDITAVYVDYFLPQFNCNFVYIDNYHIAYSLTKYLLDKGHTKIGFVGNIQKTSSIADRYFGYCKALTEKNIPLKPEWHININLEKNNDMLSLSMEHIPTAYICHCDAAAQWIYTALALKGLSIPEDVSVVSFDNTALCDTLMPKLTSVGPNKDYYAKKAFNTMIDSMSNRNKKYQTLVKTNLVERDSVKST